MDQSIRNLDRADGEPFSVLAWEIARRADWEATTDGGGVRASVWVGAADSQSRERLHGIGGTTTAAMRDLAFSIDRWAKQRS